MVSFYFYFKIIPFVKFLFISQSFHLLKTMLKRLKVLIFLNFSYSLDSFKQCFQHNVENYELNYLFNLLCQCTISTIFSSLFPKK